MTREYWILVNLNTREAFTNESGATVFFTTENNAIAHAFEMNAEMRDAWIVVHMPVQAL